MLEPWPVRCFCNFAPVLDLWTLKAAWALAAAISGLSSVHLNPKLRRRPFLCLLPLWRGASRDEAACCCGRMSSDFEFSRFGLLPQEGSDYIVGCGISTTQAQSALLQYDEQQESQQHLGWPK